MIASQKHSRAERLGLKRMQLSTSSEDKNCLTMLRLKAAEFNRRAFDSAIQCSDDDLHI
jgi:hypothetical protein